MHSERFINSIYPKRMGVAQINFTRKFALNGLLHTVTYHDTISTRCSPQIKPLVRNGILSLGQICKKWLVLKPMADTMPYSENGSKRIDLILKPIGLGTKFGPRPLRPLRPLPTPLGSSAVNAPPKSAEETQQLNSTKPYVDIVDIRINRTHLDNLRHVLHRLYPASFRGAVRRHPKSTRRWGMLRTPARGASKGAWMSTKCRLNVDRSLRLDIMVY